MTTDKKYTFKLSHYDYTKNETVSDGDVSVRTAAKCATVENVAEFVDNYVNTFSSGFERGKKVGAILATTHRTLQRSAIVELCGIIAGISEQTHTDARNERAIALAKKIAALCAEDGFGGFV